jgi:hypothetical protein
MTDAPQQRADDGAARFGGIARRCGTLLIPVSAVLPARPALPAASR